MDNLIILWLGLTVGFAFIFVFFRARWWLYLAVLFLDLTLLTTLGLDRLTQVIVLGILLVGFVLLDLFLFRRKLPSKPPQ